MMKSRLVQRRMRPSPMGALFGLLLVCLLSSSWPSSFECSTFAFAFSTSNPKAMHKMMMICPDPSQLLVRYAAPLSDKKNDNEVHLSSPVTRSQTQQMMSSSRRHVISAITSTIIAASTTISASQSAYADVTNKIASTTALRSLSNLQTQLPIRLQPLAQSNNYVGIKQCLREPPLDGIRKNMLTLVRGGEDGPKAEELLIAYKRLISALEDMDATATLGMQGRNNKKMNDPFLLSLQYDEVEKALGLFIEVGAAAASIPLQEDNGRQTKIGSIDVRSGEVTPRVL